FAGYTDTALALLENGAADNAKNREGRTALFWATLSNHRETLQALMARGADINGKDSEGRTPLFWASLPGYTDITRALLATGAHAASGKPVSSPTAKPDAAKSAGSSPTAKPDAAKSAGSSPTAKPDAAKSAGSSSATPAAPSAAGTPKSEILNQKLLQAAEAGDTTEVLSLIRDGAGVNARGST